MRGRSRLVAGPLAVVSLLLASGSAVDGLSCVGHEDVQQAAAEAVAGEHPLWADAYIVGLVESVEREGLKPITLVVTPTHAFGGDIPQRIWLKARSDGPPPPEFWRVGEHYFLGLEHARTIEDVNATVAPCAPNFRVTTSDELDRLVQAATTVEIRSVGASVAPPEAPHGTVAILGLAVAATGVAAWLAFRRRSRRGQIS